MEVRRRPSNTSTSTSRSQRESSTHVKLSLRSPSMGSATPKMEDDDDDTPRRNTRQRNPLPPTSGPLFPPLPPKQPKNSPKNSPHASRSPAVHTPTTSLPPSSSALAQALNIDPPAKGDLEPAVLEEDAVSARSVSPEEPPVPSASNTSLTPPPTSEGAVMDVDGLPSASEAAVDARIDLDGGEEKGGDDWGEYRRHRAVRGFGVSKVEVKLEPGIKAEAETTAEPTAETDGEDEETPVKTRNGKATLGALAPPSGSRPGTPSASTPGSDRGGSAPRHGRKRRGEEQLLLDDHLLPADIRQVGSKKGKTSAKDGDEEEDEPQAQEEEDEAVAVVTEDPADEAVLDEEEEGKDITRCVCKREDIDVMMIQCDECNVWQHGECMGIWGDEEAPDEYFCEECKPERHQPLRKYIRSRGRNPASFIAPTPEDLKRYHDDRDKFPPSQSKRWAEPPYVEPAPPPKHSSRSHHKKEQPPSPAEVAHDGRRSTRGRHPQGAGRSEKPVSAKQEPATAREGKRQSVAPSHTRKRSLGGAQSVSPDRSLSPHANSRLPNRRSTMNSRDAAYEEEVKAAMEASRREMLGLPEEEIEDNVPVTEERGEKRRRGDDDEEEEKEREKDRAKKGKRKKDEEEEAGSVEPPQGSGGGSNKPKHPNQYTYRPKPPSAVQQPPAAPSPARRTAQGSTPIPIAPPAHHEHGTRRAGALASVPVVYHPLTQETANNLHWHLPEYLSAFADVLPASSPAALEVRAPRTLSYLARNHFHNQHYGPFSEGRDENGKLVLPIEPVGREPVGDPSTQLDPPARVRYPLKRITVAEMRKRVRNLLEYVGRVQVEEGKRQERAKLLGIDVTALTQILQDEDTVMAEDEEVPITEDHSANHTSASGTEGNTRSMQLMDELTRDLIAFQESFSSSLNGFASPMPASVAAFPNGNGNGNGHSDLALSAPPTPVIPDAPSIPVSVPVSAPATADVGEVAVDLPSKDTATEVVIEDAVPGEETEVYREGIIDKVVISSEAEREVAAKIESIVEAS